MTSRDLESLLSKSYSDKLFHFSQRHQLLQSASYPVLQPARRGAMSPQPILLFKVRLIIYASCFGKCTAGNVFDVLPYETLKCLAMVYFHKYCFLNIPGHFLGTFGILFRILENMVTLASIFFESLNFCLRI